MGTTDVPTVPKPNSFIFMSFLAKKLQNNRLAQLQELSPPLREIMYSNRFLLCVYDVKHIQTLLQFSNFEHWYIIMALMYIIGTWSWFIQFGTKLTSRLNGSTSVSL